MTDAATKELSLTVSHHLPFPPDRVFDAWLNADMLAKFMTPGPSVTVASAETDPRVGGAFKIVMDAPEAGVMPHTGTYLAIDRPTQLKFTWVSPFSQDDSEVTLTFEPDSKGTLVTLHHVRFPDETMRDNHKGGWTEILKALAAHL